MKKIKDTLLRFSGIQLGTRNGFSNQSEFKLFGEQEFKVLLNKHLKIPVSSINL